MTKTALLLLFGLPLTASAAESPLAPDVPTAAKQIVDFIAAHPDSGLVDVVEFANKTVLPGLSVNVWFYSLTPDGANVPLAPVEGPGGKPVWFNDDHYDACGLNRYFTHARRIGDKELFVEFGGTETKLRMPKTFTTPRLTTTSHGKLRASFPVTSKPLPLSVSKDGQAAFYTFELGPSTPQGKPVYVQWWEKVKKSHPEIKLQTPSLILRTNQKGFTFDSDPSVYSYGYQQNFKAERKKNGTYTESWDLPGGTHVKLSNVCVTETEGDVPARNILTLPKYDAKKFQAERAAGKPVVIIFSLTDCPTCYRQIPVLEKLLEMEPYKQLSVFQVQGSQEREIEPTFGRYVANSLMILYKGGREIARSRGMTRPEVLKAFLDKVAKQ